MKKNMKIVLAADHAGFELKEKVREYLEKENFTVEDFGAYAYDNTDDYPDFILPAARVVGSSSNARGIIFGGSGQGEAMAANRVKGVRATVFYDGPEEIILLSRRHNDANVLSFGARFVSVEKALRLIDLWLKEPFEGERHAARVKKLDQV